MSLVLQAIIVALMNAAGTIDGVAAVNMLRTYIDTAYNGYYGTDYFDPGADGIRPGCFIRMVYCHHRCHADYPYHPDCDGGPARVYYGGSNGRKL